MNTYEIIVYHRKCNGCGDCATACPVNANGKISSSIDDKLILKVENGKLEVMNEELCTGCGMCIEACPRKALQIEYKTNDEKPAKKLYK